nr:glycoside hydrolase family 99-like domain-containing protein [Asaia platycodi]
MSDPTPEFPLIRTITPSWDNDPRRQGAGLVLHGSTPRLYERWLNETIAKAHAHPFMGEKLVCINAWNEWQKAPIWSLISTMGRPISTPRHEPSQGFKVVLSRGACF